MENTTLVSLYNVEQKDNNNENDQTSIKIDRSSSSSSEESFQGFSFSTILLPHHSNEKEEGFVDIDGYITPFENEINIFKQILYCVFPCLIPPFISNRRIEKYIRATMSISFIFTLLLIGVFIGELCVCGVASFSINPGIGPSADKIIDFGAKYSYNITQNYQIYRLFTSLFLSPSLFGLIVEIIFALRFFLYFEHRWGIILFFVTYIISGEAGVLLSCVLSCNNIAVCSMGPFAGLISVFLVDLALTNQSYKVQFKRAVFTSLIGLLVIVFAQLFPLQDFTCLLGSVIVGLVLGVLYFVNLNPWFSQQPLLLQTIVYVSLVTFLLTYFIVFCLLLFIWIQPLQITISAQTN
ncbi:rhomboid peptidase family protein [Entamoeba histolytica HM-1:IMSS-B]|uniref:rhomboid protease n=8 Tax=Entamoeba histolytica TaxID=5759 RepID=C4M529_ENTH1|nr:peptidase S54 (rhomboid) family protein [Entamoeba histolytica HM-1:IMSS]EMD48233.1 peptidase S54 (rhomboid) family protein [Entamoeba histolytica KU27]EMH74518.1 rhomboid peptidase family protein [Entamoeba histolytica HM-1:IMSS-B]EMS13334.1 peptidase S54 (rhomboid) family protein [Entamoeba histolytica HM-3:IMSS]ENY61956.1 peptidase S54 (rhomboid) family protein, putative [Entamoeba histolytica HM-1:IMSS-A]GAT96510.1 peptidase s54 rhomboid family protein [Entamoeba histolytica]|eukprot:XP_654757.1 peptidase S54 (rhomboid) family protein [Entamoeba histolytica HM-1:IMSS]